MRAVRFERFGGPEVLDVVELPEPEPGPGEVLIRAEATAINPVDDKTRVGVFGTPLPTTPGWDLAGVVVEGGGFAPGERVIAMSHQLSTGRGTWAGLVVLAAGAVAPAPRDLDPVAAATLPLPGLTALQTLDWLGLVPGERLLITGAAGAVGGLALQIARARGIEVDALVSRDAHLAFAGEHGAAFATTDPGALPERGYHAVFDTYGAFVTGAVADGGRYASIASQAGPVPDLSGRGVRTVGIEVAEDGEGLRELSALADRGLLRPRVDSVFALDDVRAAHERFARGGLAGKVAVTF